MGVFQSKWRQSTSLHPRAVRTPHVSKLTHRRWRESPWLEMTHATTNQPANNLHLKQFISVALSKKRYFLVMQQLSLSLAPNSGKTDWENTRKTLFRNQPEITSNAAEDWKIPKQEKPCFALWKSPAFYFCLFNAFHLQSACFLRFLLLRASRRRRPSSWQGRRVVHFPLCLCGWVCLRRCSNEKTKTKSSLLCLSLVREKMMVAIGGFVVQHTYLLCF